MRDSNKNKGALVTVQKFVKSPAFIMYVICCILLSITLAAAGKAISFSSDDVFWQTILLLGWHGNGTVMMGNPSIYADKIPFYALFNAVFEPSRKALFIEAYLATMAGFSLFYISSIYFLKKLKAKINFLTLLPFAWLASLGYSITSLYLNPNSRSFQIGLSFAYFALVVSIYVGDMKLRSVLSKILVLVASIYAGLQIFSDPYFLYFTIIPIVLFGVLLAIKRIVKTRSSILVGSSILVALLSGKIFSIIFSNIGIKSQVSYPSQFVPFDQLGAHFMQSIQGMLTIFSADFFGLDIAKFSTIVAILNFAILGYAVYLAISKSAHAHHLDIKQIKNGKVWIIFFSLVSLFIFAVYTFSTMAVDSTSYRYFLILCFSFVLIISATINNIDASWLKRSVTLFMLLAIIFNMVLAIDGQLSPRKVDLSSKANIENYKIIQVLEDRGYSKGYANYWQGNINTYLSDKKVVFLPSLCDGGVTKKFHWLINDSAFYTKADKTFYLIDPSISAPGTCPLKNITGQLGKPTGILPVDGKLILLYNYDITRELPNLSFKD